jgi:hypothetical protein
LTRLSGLFAILFGSFYLSEGFSWLHRFASGATSRDLFWAHYQTAVILFDFFVGGCSILAGLGMLVHREWGRKTWLALLTFTLFLHFVMTLANHAAGIDVSRSYGWVGMVVVATLISWAYLTRPAARVHFR